MKYMEVDIPKGSPDRTAARKEELHKNVKGDVKWEKGTQINRPDETMIKKRLDEVL